MICFLMVYLPFYINAEPAIAANNEEASVESKQISKNDNLQEEVLLTKANRKAITEIIKEMNKTMQAIMTEPKIKETISETMDNILDDPEIKELLKDAKQKSKKGCQPCQAEKMLEELTKNRDKFLKKYLNPAKTGEITKMLETQLKEARKSPQNSLSLSEKLASQPSNPPCKQKPSAETLRRNIMDITIKTILTQIDNHLRIPPNKIIEKYKKRAGKGDEKAKAIIARIKQINELESYENIND